jgi:RNA polymerase sigma-70 factor, ECF subfamily
MEPTPSQDMGDDKDLSVADMAALGRAIEEHQPKLLAMVRRRIDPSLAVRIEPEEVLSEAFLQARRKWKAFCAQSSFTPYAWLYRIVLDCLLEAWDRETRGKRDFRREMPWPERSSMQLGLKLLASTTSPSRTAAREELRRLVRQIMEQLPPQDQEILSMRHFDQLSFREAAEMLGITENAATVRCARALRRFKDLWRHLTKENGPNP